MRLSLPLLSFALLLSTAAPAAAARSEAPEEKLTRALEGRVAGEPVDCLNLRDIRSSRIINGTGILYETRGGTLYLNRPRSGRESLSSFDVLVTKTIGSQLCSIDTVSLYDASAGMQTGFVFLGDFIPYRKPGAR